MLLVACTFTYSRPNDLLQPAFSGIDDHSMLITESGIVDHDTIIVYITKE